MLLSWGNPLANMTQYLFGGGGGDFCCRPQTRLTECRPFQIMHLSMLSWGEGGVRVGVGILTFCPKFMSKTTPPGQRILAKKAQKSPPKGRGVMSNVPTQRQVIHSRHPPRPNQTKKLYVAKPTKNRNHSSNQLHEIK